MTNTSASREKIFRGGLPYGPELKRLNEAFPSLELGQTITHTEMSDVLELDRNGPRYSAIVRAWRKSLLRNCDIDCEPVPGVGIRVMTPAERQEFRRGRWRGRSRLVDRERRTYATIPVAQLTEAQKARFDNDMHAMNKIAEAQKDVRKLLTVNPVQSLPKPKLVK